MKNILAGFLFPAVLFLECALHAQVAPSIEWQKCLGGSWLDEGYSIDQTTDGGFIVAGSCYSNDSDVSGNHLASNGYPSIDFWIVKLDTVGNIVWQKCFGGSYGEVANSIHQTLDGGFIVAGRTSSEDGDVSGNHGGGDYWVLKLSSEGNLLWQKCLGGHNVDQAYSVQQTIDGGYIIAGSSSSADDDVSGHHGNAGSNPDCWIVKLDSVGNLVWEKSLGGEGVDRANSIQQTNDGGFIIAGDSNYDDGDVSGNHGFSDYWIVKLDIIGNIEWQKSLGGTNIDGASSIEQTEDSGFIVVGYSSSNDGDVSGHHYNEDYWIVQLDFNGNLVWEKCLGGHNVDHPNSIQQTSDGGFIIAGESASIDDDVSGNHGFYDYWIVKLDEAGNLVWQKCLGGTGDDRAYTIDQTLDGGFIIAGYSYSNNGDVSGNHGLDDYWIVKLSNDVSGIASTPKSFLSLSPNPTQSQLTINLTTPANQVAICIYDLQGRKMNCESQIANVELSSIQLNTSILPDGFYTLQIISNKTGESEVGKFVKQ